MAHARLYTYFRSSCSARVRTAANLKNIKLDYDYVHLLKAEHRKDEYVAINPMGSVPTLVLKDSNGQEIVVRQSVAILEFFEEYFPSARPLLPPASDLVGRAHVRDMVNIVNADIQPVTNMRILNGVKELGGDATAWALDFMTRGFRALENLVNLYGGKRCYGDQITLADVCLAPAVEAALRYGVDMSQFPTVKRIYDEIKVMDEFRDADWKHQADTPDEHREQKKES